MKTIRAIFLLPIKDNDGSALDQQVTSVQDALLVAFGGYTDLGFVKGSWRMREGEVSLDILARYCVTLEAGRLDELRAILQRFKTSTSQEFIYLEIQRDVDVELI